MFSGASLKKYLDLRQVSNSWLTVTSTPATFEEKFLFPEFDPLLRSQPRHHKFVGKISKQLKTDAKFIALETPNGLHVVARGSSGQATHFCTEEDVIITWSLIDAMRRRGIDVNHRNFETLEIDLPESVDKSTRNSILKFLAASRALGKSKHFGLASIKRDPAKFAQRLDSDAAAIFNKPH